MNQSINYTTMMNDGVTARRYTGFPLNSTLVSSYTPDTIRSIINQAASGQPYNTPVWIRVSRLGIQVSAQDPQIARTRKPVFIPIGLIHDIFMQPNINNVLCIVYDEVQSNMKGVLLYVVHPTDAQLIREDFRLAKQASNNPTNAQTTYSSPFDNRFSNAIDLTRSDLRMSPRRPTLANETVLLTTPTKSSYQSSREDRPHRRGRSPKKSRAARSPARPPSDKDEKLPAKNRSRSLDKPARAQELSEDEIRMQQQIFAQQQMATWQTNQQMPLIPMGVYNRYVPKTIPLPTGETLKTKLPSSDNNGLGLAYIEPLKPEKTPEVSVAKPTSKTTNLNPKAKNNDENDDTKRYLKLLIEEMQSLKAEMNRLRQNSTGSARGRTDSIQVDLKQLRSEIDLIRSRIAMTPRIFGPK